MATANKEDILLRQLLNAPLVTKGSELDFADFDNNLITIFNQLVTLSNSTNVDAYSAAITYDNANNNYVSHDNQLWKMVNANPQTNVTPGTDATTWVKVYASDLVGPPTGIKTFSKLIPSAEVLTMGFGDTPVDLIASPGVDKVRQAINGSITIDFDEGSPSGTPYNTNTTILIGHEGMDFAGSESTFNITNILDAEIKKSEALFKSGISPSPLVNSLFPNQKIVAVAEGGNPLGGDSDIIIRGQYVEFDIS